MNKEQRINAKNDFFKLMNNAVFEKTKKNVRKHSDVGLIKPKQ